MMQEAIVAIIVIAAAWVVAKRYAPKAIRRALRGLVVVIARRLGWSGLASKFVAEPEPDCADGCGACSGCSPTDAAIAAETSTISVEALKRTAPRL
jgi:hypothetical protein